MLIYEKMLLGRGYMEGDPEPTGGGGGGGDPAPTPAVPSGDPTPTPEAGTYFQSMPDDWRNQAVASMGLEPGDDFDKRMGQLERVSDFGSMTKNYFESQDRIRKGEISSGLPENPSDDQMASWREANGVPAEAGAYELSLSDGLVLSEADGRIMEGVYGAAHAGNVSTETMSAITDAMLKGRQAESDAQTNQDGMDTQTTERQLKDAWGGDYEANINMVKGLVNQLPETVKEAFASARMGDGKAMFNSPEIMMAMSDWARKINPAATVVPGSNNPMQSINDEITALEARMSNPEWFKDQPAQDRYQKLITAREGMSAA